MSETRIQTAIRNALAYAPDLMLMRNRQSGRGKLKAGLGTGSADLVGILRLSVLSTQGQRVTEMWPAQSLARIGRFFALEVKAPGGTVSEEQKEWLLTVRLFGGFAAVVDSVGEAMAALARARKGASE